MSGTMIVIDADGHRDERTLKAAPKLEELQKMVGGYIQLVPAFNRVAHSSGMQKCVVLCNEDGKNLDMPVNQEATRLWQLSAGSQRIYDVLVGPIVILFGDHAFMAEL